MSLEDRIRNELHDTAERLALDPGEYRRAIEDAARRRHRRLLGAGVASAGVVALSPPECSCFDPAIHLWSPRPPAPPPPLPHP